MNYPNTFDIKNIIQHTLDEYDSYSIKIIKQFDKRGFKCVYPALDFEQHILIEKNTYSVTFLENHKQSVSLNNCFDVWPVMIGSRLDNYITHRNTKLDNSGDLVLIELAKLETFKYDIDEKHTKNIAITCFLINGILKQLPYFVTFCPEVYHCFKDNVRKFSYNLDENGTLINYNKTIDEFTINNCGGEQLPVSAILTIDNIAQLLVNIVDKPNFVKFYLADVLNYVRLFGAQNKSINSLANKMVYSPGSFLYRLLHKNLLIYVPKTNVKLIDKNLRVKITQLATKIKKCINNGQLLFVISKTSKLYQEKRFNNQITLTTCGGSINNNNTCGDSDGRNNFNAGNNEKFFEKKKSCYKDVSLSRYQLIPYLSQIVSNVISDRAQTNYTAFSFDESYVGFFCGTFSTDSKAVGKLTILTRNVLISYISKKMLRKLIDHLIRPIEMDILRMYSSVDNGYDQHILLFNNVPLRLPENTFEQLRINLRDLKRTFQYLECYELELSDTERLVTGMSGIIVVRYINHIMFKHIPQYGYFVSPTDFFYWLDRENLATAATNTSFTKVIDKLGFDFLTSHITDLLPFYRHNPIHKLRGVITALKNSILAIDSKFSNYFRETTNVFFNDHSQYRAVLRPVDEFSAIWLIKLPLINVLFQSFGGLTQEDSIVLNEDIGRNLLTIHKNYRIRFKISNCDTPFFTQFRPNRGQLINHRNEHKLGVIYNSMRCPFKITNTTQTAFFTTMFKTKNKNIGTNDHSMYKLFVRKQGVWAVEKYEFNHLKTHLIITLGYDHTIGTGDKISNRHGQKNVVTAVKGIDMPVAVRRNQSITGSTSSIMVHNGIVGKCSDENEIRTIPGLLQNSVSMIKRQTMGQIKEMLSNGGDEYDIYNPRTDTYKIGTGFMGQCSYLIIDFLCHEKLYEASKCAIDQITGQPVKGTSRNGGLRAGLMEVNTGFRANGLASAAEEKLVWDSDREILQTSNTSWVPFPKNIHMCLNDAKTLKVDFRFKTNSIIEEYGK